jgi:hypothetical protein
MSDNYSNKNYSNKIYFLETDKTHTIEQFKIVKYCSIENLDFKQPSTDTKRDFPKKGELVINIKNVYDINDMHSLINNEFTEFNHSTDKKLYIVHEKEENGYLIQYLYYTDDYNYNINNDKIIKIDSCYQTKFDFISDKTAENDFQERVKVVQDFLNKIDINIKSLRSKQLINEPDSKIKGGSIPNNYFDLNVTDYIEKLFRNMIGNYIKAVNEFINLPNLKKVLALNHNDLNDLTDLKNYIILLDQFHYVGINNTKFKSSTNHKFFMIGADFKGDKRNNIKDVVNNKENETTYLTTGIEVPEKAKQNIKNKYEISDLTKNKVYFNINDFANEILENIYLCKEKYSEIQTSGSTIDKNDKELNKDLAYFFYYILDIIEKEKQYIDNILKSTKLLEILNNNNELKSAINQKIQTKIDSSILTYLKIRNDQDGDKDYNKQRFNIQLENISGGGNTTKTMVLDYNDEHKEYYKKDAANNYVLISDEQQEYQHKYIFGNFTNIFHPSKTNSEIAGYVDEIINRLNEEKPKPVFVMGYGSSGAGKTSTLISRKKNENKREDGILIEICNKLAKAQTYNKINVKIIELYKDPNKDKDDTRVYTTNYIGFTGKTTGPEGKNTTQANFTYKNDSFTLDEKITHTNNHPFRVYKQEKLKENMENKTFKTSTQLGDYLTYVIDTDRHVKGTPNNINSSRSHSLVFLELSNTANIDKKAYLIVGDFAGVENEFNCENNETINDFLSIKKLDGKLFYENEIYKSTKDPIGKIVQTGGGENEKRVIQEALQGIPFDYGNISKIPKFLDEHISKVNNNIVDLLNFKKSIRLVRAMANIPMDDKGKEIKMLDEAQITIINDIDTKKYTSAWKNYKEQAINKIQEVSRNAESNKQNTIEYNAKQELKSLFTGEKWGPDPNEPTGRFIKQKGSIYDPFLNNEEYLKKKLIEIPEISNSIINDPKIKAREEAKEESKLKSINKDLTTNLDGNPLYFAPINNPTNGFTVLEECFVKEVSKPTKAYLKRKIFEKMKKSHNIQIENLFFTFEKQKNQVGFELTTRYEFSKEYVNMYKNLKENEQNKRFILDDILGVLGRIPTVLDIFPKSATKAKFKLKSEGIPIGSGNHKNPFVTLVENFKDITYQGTTDSGSITTDDDLRRVLENEVNNSKIFSFSLIAETFETEKKFIDSLLKEDSQLFDYLIELEKYTYEKQDLGKSVCENRRIEGTFINQSLFELREMIREILMIKNKDMLHVVPNYVNICFDKYCPTHKGCFSFNSTVRKNQKNNSQNSLIIQEIQKYFNDDLNSSYKTTGEINKQLYTDLVLCIFCVLNISKGANNPPPVPYVDINELKRIVYNYNLFPQKRTSQDKKNISSFIFYAQKLINDINHKYIESYNVDEEKQFRNLLESVKTIEVQNNKFESNENKFKVVKNFSKEEIETDFTTYYKTFLFILDNLMSGKETLTGHQEIEELIVKIQGDLNKAKVQEELQSTLSKTNTEEIEKTKNEIMFVFKKYRLFDLNLLIHYLQLDAERLIIAQQAINNKSKQYNMNTFETAVDKSFKGYDPRLIYNPELIAKKTAEQNDFIDKYAFIAFSDDERSEFNYSNGTNDEMFQTAFGKESSENEELLREKIYTGMRMYIQNKIKVLYRKIFTERPDINIIELVVDEQINSQEKNNAIHHLSIIKKYIDQQVSYYESDIWYDPEKIEMLDFIIHSYGKAEAALDNIQQIINNEINKLQDEGEKRKGIKFSILKGQIEELQKKLEELTNPESEANNDNRLQILKNKQHNIGLFCKKSDKYMGFLEEFLRIIDNNNDASSVGTLEFLDKMAKLNTVSTICNFETQKLNEASDNFDKKLNLELKDLYWN